METHESNEPRWSRPPVEVVAQIPREAVVYRAPAPRFCANVACAKRLSQLNLEPLCFACQQLRRPKYRS